MKKTYKRKYTNSRFYSAVLGGVLGIFVLLVTFQSVQQELNAGDSPVENSLGTVQGALDINPHGGAVYKIPVKVAPGIRGLQPRLALTYNSLNRSNGPLGLGWTLEGLMEITRCGRARYLVERRDKDGNDIRETGGVNYDENDRLCINGQRLVLPVMGPGDSYWGKDKVYRTEIESFVTVQANTHCNQGSCTFTAKDKDGRTLTFGKTAESRVSGGGGREFAWKLTEVADAFGNRMTISYELSTNYSYPKTIEYDNRSVEFVYEDKTGRDTSYTFDHGQTIRLQKKRLSQIRVKMANAQVFKQYYLSYQSSPYTARSRMESIRECDGSNNCLEATTFEWKTNSDGERARYDIFPLEQLAGTPMDMLRINLLPGDFNGDGKTDLLRQERGFLDDNEVDTFSILYATTPGQFEWKKFNDPAFARHLKYDQGYKLITGDFNGDGRTDFLRMPRAELNDVTNNPALFAVFLSKPGADQEFTAHSPATKTVTGPDGSTYEFKPYIELKEKTTTLHTGDFNGDGKTDLLRQVTKEDGVLFHAVLLSDGTGNFDIVVPTNDDFQNALYSQPGAELFMGDYNGDGLTDFVRQSKGGLDFKTGDNFAVYFSKGDGTFRKAATDPELETGLKGGYGSLSPGDYNGDGKTDLLLYRDLYEEYKVLFSYGDGRFFDIGFRESMDFGLVVTPADYDGDGRTDFMMQGGTNKTEGFIYKFGLYTSEGGGGFKLSNKSGRGDLNEYLKIFAGGFNMEQGTIIIPGDFDGDGRSDFVRQAQSFANPLPLKVYLNRSSAREPDSLIAKIHRGHRHTEEIDYAPLSRSQEYEDGVYTKQAYTPANNKIEMRVPMWVVKKTERYNPHHPNYHRVSQHYKYAKAQMDTRGRGFSGFEKVIVSSPELDERKIFEYLSDGPFQGRFSKLVVQKLSENKNLKIKTQSWVFKDMVGKNTYRILPELESKTEYTGDRGLTTRTKLTYDEYGFPIVRALYEYDNRALFECKTFRTDEALPDFGRVQTVIIAPSLTGTTCFNPFSQVNYEYNEVNGSLKSETKIDGSSQLKESYEYDDKGNRTAVIDSNDLREETEYDDVYHTYPVKVVYAVGGPALTTEYAYHGGHGVVLEKTDPAGGKILLAYDSFGRVIKKSAVEPGGVSEILEERFYLKYVHSMYDSVTTRKYTGRNKTGGQQFYAEKVLLDFLDRPTHRTRFMSDQATAVNIITAYDVKNRKISETEPHLVDATTVTPTEYEYDDLDRPISITSAIGVVTNIKYDVGAEGCGDQEISIKYTTGGERQRVFCRNAKGKETRKIFLSDDGQTRQRMEYDSLGRVLKLYATEGEEKKVGSETTYEYDGFGRTASINHTQRGLVKYTYEKARLKSRSVPGQGTIDFSYDAAGRVVRKNFPDGRIHEFTYDSPTSFSNGRLTRMYTKIEENGTIIEKSVRVFGYDYRGRVRGETLQIDGRSYNMGYTYYADNSLRAVRYPDGALLLNAYNAAGNLTNVSMKQSGQAEYVDYAGYSNFTALGQPRNVEYGNKVDTKYTYGANRRVESVITSGKAPEGTETKPVLSNRSITWNGFGEVTKIQDELVTTRTQSFSYNKLGYLTNALGPYGNLKYEYDAAGNLIHKAGVTYTYKGERPTSGTNGLIFGYDDRGNRSTKTIVKNDAADIVETYAYDSQNKLLNVTRGGESLGEFQYDAAGKRIKKTDANGVISLYLNSLYEVTILKGGNVLHTKYLPGPGGRVAGVTTEVQELAANFQYTQHSMQAAMYDAGTVSGFMGYGNHIIMMFASHPTGLGVTAIKFPLLLLFTLLLSLVTAWYFFRAARREGLIGKLRDGLAGILLQGGFISESQAQKLGESYATDFMARNSRMARPIPLLVFSFLAFFVLNCGAERPDNIRSILGGHFGLTQLSNGLIHANLNRQMLPGPNGDGYPVAGTHFFHPDHLGSASLVTDALGKQLSFAFFKPYGEIDRERSEGPDLYRSKFTGKEWDASAQLYYFNARHYDPVTGRFIQADTMPLGSNGSLATDLNRYAYAGNSPVVYTDPSGRFILMLITRLMMMLMKAIINALIEVIIDSIFNAILGETTDLGQSFANGFVKGLRRGPGAAFGKIASKLVKLNIKLISKSHRAAGRGSGAGLRGTAGKQSGVGLRSGKGASVSNGSRGPSGKRFLKQEVSTRKRSDLAGTAGPAGKPGSMKATGPKSAIEVSVESKSVKDNDMIQGRNWNQMAGDEISVHPAGSAGAGGAIGPAGTGLH